MTQRQMQVCWQSLAVETRAQKNFEMDARGEHDEGVGRSEGAGSRGQGRQKSRGSQ